MQNIDMIILYILPFIFIFTTKKTKGRNAGGNPPLSPNAQCTPWKPIFNFVKELVSKEDYKDTCLTY